jgi:hypothetical protein
MIRGGMFFDNVSTVTQAINLEDVLAKHRNIFADEMNFAASKFEPLKLNLKDEFLEIDHRPQKFAIAEEKMVEDEIDRWIEQGIVEKSESRFNNRLVAVFQKGKLRLCTDLRDLNKNLLNYSYPIPVILELMEKLKDFTYISILDLKKSYLQWSIDEDSRDYLSFTSKKHGKLRFTRMPVRIVSDRGTEFNWIEKMGILHSRTSAYTPELNGRLERKHKELSKICRILDVSVEEAANKLNTDEELKRFNEECIDQVKGLRRGDYVLRYDRTENRPKHKDVWKGPYQIIEILDDRSFELSTGSVVDMRDVKPFKRWFEPTWKIRDEVLIQVCNEFLIEHQKLNDVFDHPNPWIISWNVDSRICFIHCGYRDLFDAILKAQEDKPGKALFVIPQMEEQRYYKFLENLNAVWYDPQEAVFELNGKVIEVPYAVWFVMINHSDWEL